jgi:hypothetical protein
VLVQVGPAQAAGSEHRSLRGLQGRGLARARGPSPGRRSGASARLRWRRGPTGTPASCGSNRQMANLPSWKPFVTSTNLTCAGSGDRSIRRRRSDRWSVAARRPGKVRGRHEHSIPRRTAAGATAMRLPPSRQVGRSRSDPVGLPQYHALLRRRPVALPPACGHPAASSYRFSTPSAPQQPYLAPWLLHCRPRFGDAAAGASSGPVLEVETAEAFLAGATFAGALAAGGHTPLARVLPAPAGCVHEAGLRPVNLLQTPAMRRRRVVRVQLC